MFFYIGKHSCTDLKIKIQIKYCSPHNVAILCIKKKQRARLEDLRHFFISHSVGESWQPCHVQPIVSLSLCES